MKERTIEMEGKLSSKKIKKMKREEESKKKKEAIEQAAMLSKKQGKTYGQLSTEEIMRKTGGRPWLLG